MTEKIKVSREVAEAYEFLLSKNWNKLAIGYFVYGSPFDIQKMEDEEEKERFLEIKRFFDYYFECAKEEEGILKLLVGDYEIMNPEEEISSEYEVCEFRIKEMERLGNHTSKNHYSGKRQGILRTLDILNIKIKGIND